MDTDNSSNDNTPMDDANPGAPDTPPGVTPISNREAALMLQVERERADRKALIGEFAKATTSEGYEKVKDLFAENVVSAADSVVHLSKHAESESIQLNASKYIIETFLGRGKMAGDDADLDFQKFIASMAHSTKSTDKDGE